MVKSYRGKEVNMDKIIQQQGSAMSLGNTNLNGFGDEIKHGKIVKTRAERLQEYLKNKPIKKEASVNLADDKTSEEIEKEVAQNTDFDEIKRPKVKAPKQPQPSFVEGQPK